jgi:hypothetical protein
MMRPLRIVPVSKIKHPRSWAIYGRSGSGKTTFAASFPKPILFLDVNDRGTRSIADVEGIDVAQITHWDQFEQARDMLLASNNKYQTAVIDTMTQAQLLAVNLILSRARKPAIVQVEWGSLTMQQWAAVGAQVKELITLWRNLPIEVCFIAQERTFNMDQDSGNSNDSAQLLPEVGAALSPQTAAHLNASVEVIANTFIRLRRRTDTKKRTTVHTTHAMRLGPHPVYTTKARKPITIELPAEVDNPTHDIVVDIIEGRTE